MSFAKARTSLIFSSLGVFAFAAGCALFGGGGDSVPKAKGYQVTVPQGWREQDRAEGDRAFRLPSGSLVAMNSSCTRNSRAPLEVLTKHLLIGSRNVEIEAREKLKIAGSEGLYSKVRATVEGTPFHLQLVVLPKNGCVFDFSLMSPKPIVEREAEDFLAFAKSFHYGSD